MNDILFQDCSTKFSEMFNLASNCNNKVATKIIDTALYLHIN